MRLLFEAEAAQNSAVHGKSVHGIIRLHKHLILLRSLHYDYYRFPGGEIMPDETPEQALIRTVQAETGLTVLPESIRECGAVREVCSENGEKVTVREDCYYDCEVSEKKLPHDKSTDRFLPMPVLLPDALTLNRSEKHGAVSGEAAFQTMLRRETGVLQYLQEIQQVPAERIPVRIAEPEVLYTPKGQKWAVRLAMIISIISLIMSVLSPLAAGTGASLAGVKNPNEGGMMPPDSAFALYALIWGALMIPGVLLSLLALTCSVTALGIRLIFRRSKYIGIAAVAVAWTAFGYAALITVPWLAVIIPEWIRRMISI